MSVEDPARGASGTPTASGAGTANTASSAAANTERTERLRRDIRATLMPGFSGFTTPDWVRDAFAEGLLSVCIYGENVRDAEQLRALGAELREALPEALIAIDEEGGEVTRLHYLEGSPYPGAAVLGRIDDIEYTELIGERVGRDILSAGFNLALGPIADVNSNPKNPVIGTRSFAADPELAGRHAAAWVRGLQRTGALACAKHFPGHGDTAQDSHLALPTVDEPLGVLEHRELPPFRAVVNAGVATVMTSHILLPQIDPTGPATFSRTVLQGLLRDQLDFEGVIVSDALDMQGASGEVGIPEAAVLALIAGCDLLCIGPATGPVLLREIEDTVLAAIDSGRLDEDRLAEAARRVRALATPVAAAQPSPSPASPSDVLSPAIPRLHSESQDASSAASPSPVILRSRSESQDPSREELTRIVESFAGLAPTREWLTAHPRAAVLRIDSEANMAVGHAPWGPFAAAADPQPIITEEARAFASRDRIEAGDTHAHPQGVIVIGRDMHRLPHARAAIDALRAAGAAVLTVEMGWPSDEAAGGYADLGCYGSTRLVGAALLQLLEGAPA